MRRIVTLLLALTLIPALSAQQARASVVQVQQTFPVITANSAGPPCIVSGGPDEKLCLSSNQDGVAPQSAPWVTATRWNTSANWTITYGAWTSNETAVATFGNVRAVIANLAYDSALQHIVDDAETGASTATIHMAADTPYVTITLEHVNQPEAVTWRGQPLTFLYDGTNGGSLTLTPTFTSGSLVISFPSGSGSVPTMIPYLPGLTNFPQLDLVPNPAHIVAFSCDNVTLTDPRRMDEVSSTRLWIFDWGDGTQQTRTKSPSASHVYGSPGIYNVTMTVQTASGSGIGYSGTVDTTTLSCTFHIARQVGFVVLTGATGLLIALSLILPKRTKQEKKRMRRQALACAVGVVLLVVVL